MDYENRVYYGEYNLYHWLELLFNGNIVLPEYQRLFVWDKLKVKKLIESIDKDLFIPPIIIGSYKTGDEKLNLIIDGQQRLTSILLAYLSIYPKKENFKTDKKDIKFANENDDSVSFENEEDIIGWTYKDLIEIGKSKNDIEKKLSLNSIKNYEPLYNTNEEQVINVDKNFLENHYLGFSFLMPESNQQKYFSSVFREINAGGKKLSNLETRRSLYFLSEGKEKFFDPKCIEDICVRTDKGIERIDFVRYLSFLFQYNKDGNVENIAKHSERHFEQYYISFIDSIINNEKDSSFSEYKTDYLENISKLSKSIKNLNLQNRRFPSIIDADVYIFGLVYYTILKGKIITEDKKEKLTTLAENQLKYFKELSKDCNAHKKTPSALKYLKQRIKKSIQIYEGLINEQTL